jgi:hypothetical protein
LPAFLGGTAGAQNVAPLRTYCGQTCARAQNENQLVQLGAAKVRADCVALVYRELMRHEGRTPFAVSALKNARFHADRCILRTGTLTGNFSWSEALANLVAAQAHWKSAVASRALTEKFPPYDRGRESMVADTWDLTGSAPEKLQKIDAFCKQEASKLSALEAKAREPAVAAFLAQNSYVREIVTLSTSRAKFMFDHCKNWVVGLRYADAVGCPSDLADMVASIGRALGGAPGGTTGGNAVQKDIEEALERIKKARELMAAETKLRGEKPARGPIFQMAIDRVGAAYGLLRQANELMVKAAKEQQALRAMQPKNSSVLSSMCSVWLGVALPFATLVVTQYIEAHRQAAALLSKFLTPLTPAEMTELGKFFPARILSAVRIFEYGAGAHGLFSDDTQATTYSSDLIFVKPGERGAKNVLKHELVHACQYDRLGLAGFAAGYVTAFAAAGCDYATNLFEKQAYDYEPKSVRIGVHLGYCH